MASAVTKEPNITVRQEIESGIQTPALSSTDKLVYCGFICNKGNTDLKVITNQLQFIEQYGSPTKYSDITFQYAYKLAGYFPLLCKRVVNNSSIFPAITDSGAETYYNMDLDKVYKYKTDFILSYDPSKTEFWFILNKTVILKGELPDNVFNPPGNIVTIPKSVNTLDQLLSSLKAIFSDLGCEMLFDRQFNVIHLFSDEPITYSNEVKVYYEYFSADYVPGKLSPRAKASLDIVINGETKSRTFTYTNTTDLFTQLEDFYLDFKYDFKLENGVCKYRSFVNNKDASLEVAPDVENRSYYNLADDLFELEQNDPKWTEKVKSKRGYFKFIINSKEHRLEYDFKSINTTNELITYMNNNSTEIAFRYENNSLKYSVVERPYNITWGNSVTKNLLFESRTGTYSLNGLGPISYVVENGDEKTVEVPLKGTFDSDSLITELNNKVPYGTFSLNSVTGLIVYTSDVNNPLQFKHSKTYYAIFSTNFNSGDPVEIIDLGLLEYIHNNTLYSSKILFKGSYDSSRCKSILEEYVPEVEFTYSNNKFTPKPRDREVTLTLDTSNSDSVFNLNEIMLEGVTHEEVVEVIEVNPYLTATGSLTKTFEETLNVGEVSIKIDGRNISENIIFNSTEELKSKLITLFHNNGYKLEFTGNSYDLKSYGLGDDLTLIPDNSETRDYVNLNTLLFSTDLIDRSTYEQGILNVRGYLLYNKNYVETKVEVDFKGITNLGDLLHYLNNKITDVEFRYENDYLNHAPKLESDLIEFDDNTVDNVWNLNKYFLENLKVKLLDNSSKELLAHYYSEESYDVDTYALLFVVPFTSSENHLPIYLGVTSTDPEVSTLSFGSSTYDISLNPDKIDYSGLSLYYDRLNELELPLVLVKGIRSTIKGFDGTSIGKGVYSPASSKHLNNFTYEYLKVLENEEYSPYMVSDCGYSHPKITLACRQVAEKYSGFSVISTPNFGKYEGTLQYVSSLTLTNLHYMYCLVGYYEDSTIVNGPINMPNSLQYMVTLAGNMSGGREFKPIFAAQNGSVAVKCKLNLTKAQRENLATYYVNSIRNNGSTNTYYITNNLTFLRIVNELGEDNNARLNSFLIQLSEKILENVLGEYNTQKLRDHVVEQLTLAISKYSDFLNDFRISTKPGDANHFEVILEVKFNGSSKYITILSRSVLLNKDLGAA